MASDITEEFQIDITRTSAIAVSGNTGLVYDLSFNDEKFFDATSETRRYIRQTAQYRKDQSDNSSEPGEQSLTGWWLRSQSSFHFGSGINFYEPSQDEKLRFRFADSEGVDVWTQGQVSLLKNVVAGHIVTGPSQTHMRSIRYGTTDAVLMVDDYDVDKILLDGTEVHFVDYNAGVDTPVYSICDNGVDAFWVTNKVSNTKWTVLKKPLTGNAATAETLVYQAGGAASRAIIEYVKERLIVCVNNEIWEVTPAGSATKLYTAPSTTFEFTSIAETGSDIYVSGHDGIRSVVFRLTVSNDGSIAALLGAVVAAEMPRGEIIYAIQYYLGYMLIGTSRGVRVAQVVDGGIIYGPLLFEAEQPVYQFATSDKYAWATVRIGGDTGLVRIDLGTQIDTLVFPYANDLQAVDVARQCTGVAFMGQTNRLAFSAAGNGSDGNVYIESATQLRSNGFLKTGKIRFNTSENKFFKYIKERAIYTGGSIALATTDSAIVTVDAVNGNNDVGIPEREAVEYKQFVFTLNRSSSDASVGPTLLGYQVKALPATPRQRIIQYNLWCFDHETDKNRNRVGYFGRAYQRIEQFESLEAASDIVTVQDHRTGEAFQALIEECSFQSTTPPSGQFNGFGGVLTVTVRKI